MNLKRTLIVGILFNLFGLAWVLIKFPAVHLWTVLMIVVSVALLSFQFGVFLLIRTLEALFKAMLKANDRTHQRGARKRLSRSQISDISLASSRSQPLT